MKDNCVKEHKVEFYANKLFVTPQYLSLVLKNTSGKTAYQWIVDGIITESKILLKDVDSTIQQISENLYFPDSSSFSKFFKKQTGVSPFKYRNMNSEAQLLF
ncbi:helix-turn-helix domain-containing protein [Dysgonomonas sp. 521]|uniref:helix-turn-helix domain-containing protein n=1 Tax=Dysgonomonas sp. 521 TaxID=2302932 RepID=UPI0013D371FB|nr:helix-turn-helix domain-containing protein [Dysgonomonas sp. 521]